MCFLTFFLIVAFASPSLLGFCKEVIAGLLREHWWPWKVASVGVGVGLPPCWGSLAAFLFVSYLLPLVTVGDSLQGASSTLVTCFSASNRKLLSLEMNANELPAVLFCIPGPLAAVILFST